MCPYYLDGDHARRPDCKRTTHSTPPSGDVVGDYPFAPPLIEWRGMWLLCSFQGPSERAGPLHPVCSAPQRDGMSRPCRSLKTQQHARLKLRGMRSSPSQNSVDVLGHSGVAGRARWLPGPEGPAACACRRDSEWAPVIGGSLERR